jgi:hypothetical protein
VHLPFNMKCMDKNHFRVSVGNFSKIIHRNVHLIIRPVMGARKTIGISNVGEMAYGIFFGWKDFVKFRV